MKTSSRLSKTEELAFHRPNFRNYLALCRKPGLDHRLCAKLLGIWLQNDLSMKKHLDYVMHLCNQYSYLLTQLTRLGLPLKQLQCIFDAIILSRVLYAAPAWRKAKQKG